MGSSRKSPRSRVVACVADAVRAHVPPGARLALGLSGGVDSVVLLDALAPLAASHAFVFTCIHVHHGLSPNADAWAAFCAERAAHHGVPIAVERVDIGAHPGRGLEGAARAARHAAFARHGADVVALAHHRDDQAETLLLQLVRGAGLPGLAAMPVWRPAAEGPALLRPLLDVARGEILDHARARGLRWIEDESNDDVRLARNLVRHQVLPLLARINAAAAGNLARSAGHLRDALALAEAIGRADLDACGGLGLRVDALAALDPARARNALRVLLQDLRLPVPETATLAELLHQLTGARDDAAVRVDIGPVSVRRYRGRVCVVPAQPEPPSGFRRAWPGDAEWRLPELDGVLRFVATRGEGIAAEHVAPGAVEIRGREGGERLRPVPGGPSRTLKNLLQEAGMPPWERLRVPLVYCRGSLACVPGVGVDARWAAASGAPGVRVEWNSPDSRKPR
jgi:tRNA(Ile)-lysidine synthase